MATAIDALSYQRKKDTTYGPPRRGKVKARIFETLVKTVVSAASKTGRGARGNPKGEGEDVDGGTSASSTPLPSSYNSDG